MNIGILTLPLKHNYGGVLQAFALQEALKGLGHNVEIINRTGKDYRRWRLLIGKLKRGVGIGVSTHRSLIAKRLPDDVQKVLHRNFSVFIAQRINLTGPYSGIGCLAELQDGRYDAVVVGSDQVWRPAYCPWLPDYFCGFDKHEKITKIAYAVSFGLDRWSLNVLEASKYSKLAKQFRAISVRESSGVHLCRKHLGVDADHVVDPTMLVDSGLYLGLIKESNCDASGMLATYVLDESSGSMDLINGVCQLLDMENSPLMPSKFVGQDASSVDKKNIYMPIGDWLACLKTAECVFTDSFHGTIFCLIFEKPFVVRGNRARGLTRFRSVLELFGLTERLLGVDASANNVVNVMRKPIDWASVRAIRKDMRQQGLGFLQDNL